MSSMALLLIGASNSSENAQTRRNKARFQCPASMTTTIMILLLELQPSSVLTLPKDDLQACRKSLRIIQTAPSTSNRPLRQPPHQSQLQQLLPHPPQSRPLACRMCHRKRTQRTNTFCLICFLPLGSRKGRRSGYTALWALYYFSA